MFGRRAIRQDGWKALFVPDAKEFSRWQLYDLSRDQGEVNDLAETHPEKLNELLALWRRYVEETSVIEEAISTFDADPSLWEPVTAPAG